MSLFPIRVECSAIFSIRCDGVEVLCHTLQLKPHFQWPRYLRIRSKLCRIRPCVSTDTMKYGEFGIRCLERFWLRRNSNTQRNSGNTLAWIFWNTLQHQQQFLIGLAPKYLKCIDEALRDIISERFFLIWFALDQCPSQSGNNICVLYWTMYPVNTGEVA